MQMYADPSPPLINGVLALTKPYSEIQKIGDVKAALENFKRIVLRCADFKLLSQYKNGHELSVVRLVMLSFDKGYPVTELQIMNAYKIGFDLMKFFLEIGIKFSIRDRKSFWCSSDINNKMPIGSVSEHDDLFRAVSFYLCQAGADPFFFRRFIYHHSGRSAITRADLCKVLVLEKYQHVTDYVIGDSQGCVDRSRTDVERTGTETRVNPFKIWYKEVTSRPFTLQCQCRTVIRRTLVGVSDHSSILPRIELLNLPQKLKQYIRYEECLSEVDLSVQVGDIETV